MKLGPITPTQQQSALLSAEKASFILQLFCFVHSVNRQVGVVSESAKSEDPRLRRRRHGETLFYRNLFLLCIFCGKSYTFCVCSSVGWVDPVHVR